MPFQGASATILHTPHAATRAFVLCPAQNREAFFKNSAAFSERENLYLQQRLIYTGIEFVKTSNLITAFFANKNSGDWFLAVLS